jgi:putative membrane protein
LCVAVVWKRRRCWRDRGGIRVGCEEIFNGRPLRRPRGERTNVPCLDRYRLARGRIWFFLFRLNGPVDAVGGGNLSHISAEEGGALITAAARYAGLALVVIGSTIVARGSTDFERRRRAIEREEVIQLPHSRAESLLSTALAIAVVIFGIYVALL